MSIVESLWDQDTYKFSMQQIVFHRFSGAQAKYAFKSRNYPGEFYEPIVDQICREVGALGSLEARDASEYLFPQKAPWAKPDYVRFLEHFRLDPDRYVSIDYSDKKGLEIEIEGPWLDTILFEVPILSIVSELASAQLARTAGLSADACHKEAVARLIKKTTRLLRAAKDDKVYVKFSDFGTRRRFSRDVHDNVILFVTSELKKLGIPECFLGTSNVWLACKHEVPMVGTMAHEYIQAGQGLVHPRDSQRYMLEQWLDEYRGELGIALTDTLGMNAFLADFDKRLAMAYSGCRQDSGDPKTWTDDLIAHYVNCGIDPRTKTAVYSDGLDFDRMVELAKTYQGHIVTKFGIGTNLTNDVGIKAPQIVIKLTALNGRPTAKISDSSGKGMCKDEVYLAYLKKTFGIKDVPK